MSEQALLQASRLLRSRYRVVYLAVRPFDIHIPISGEYRRRIHALHKVADDLRFKPVAVFSANLRHVAGDGFDAVEHHVDCRVVETVARGEVEHDDALLLSIPVQAARALHQAVWIPRQVVVDQNVTAVLQVDAFPARFGGHHEMRRFVEIVYVAPLLRQRHGTVDLSDGAVGIMRL